MVESGSRSSAEWGASKAKHYTARYDCNEGLSNFTSSGNVSPRLMKERSMHVRVLVLVALVVSGCSTTFLGDAKFPGGARGCFDRCSAQGMTMSSFVFMGDYSTGCVCGPTPQGADTSATSGGAAAASSAAAVATITQMRAAEQNAQQH